MQKLDDMFKDNSDVLNTDFSDWEDDFFDENEQFSDIENVFKSRNLIENLQSTNNVISIQNTVSPLHREGILRHKNISKLNWKEIKLSKLSTLNASHEHSLQKEDKQIDILNQEKTASNIRKYRDESSDSEDFYSPNKKLKKSKIHSVNIFSNPDKNFIRTRFPINSVNTNQEKNRSSVKGIQLQGMSSKSQIDVMVISRQKTSGSQTESASNQESCSIKMINSNKNIFRSQKTSTSQESSGSNMITSSQDISNSQMSTSQESCCSKMITSSQDISKTQKTSTSQESCDSKIIVSSRDTFKTITSSQETSVCQNIISSQETCTSPKRIASSQESLGNQVMNISIKEDSNIQNIASQSSCATQVVLTPHINSSCRQVPIHEEAKCLKSSIRNQSDNSKKLKECNQQSSDNDTLSHKKRKTDSKDKNNFKEILASSVSDSYRNETFMRRNKAEKRMIWNIRRRELEVTKREIAVENREKLLDTREADIRKREAILKANQRRYFWCKANMKKKIQKQTFNSRELRQRVLVDETNAFNGACI